MHVVTSFKSSRIICKQEIQPTESRSRKINGDGTYGLEHYDVDPIYGVLHAPTHVGLYGEIYLAHKQEV